jgi:hypothetical protein
MLRWFSRTPKQSLLSYSLLRAVPSRSLPQELADQEASSEYYEKRERIEADLNAQPYNEDEPKFFTFLKSDNGLLQMLLPELDGGCLLAFSTPFRAVDYASVAAPGKIFACFCSSPKQVVFMRKDLREYADVRHIALDRCPRCDIFTVISASAVDTAAKVVDIRNISLATQIARCNLYCEYARSAATNGEFLRARDVALELVGHVTAEDPRPHLLLGKLAVQLRDKRLLREAKNCLTALKQGQGIEELEIAKKTRRVEF